VVVVRTQNFQSPDARGSGRKAKFSQVQPRVVVVKTQNFLCPAARGSGERNIVSNAKFT